jgi:perosamine synthetase
MSAGAREIIDVLHAVLGSAAQPVHLHEPLFAGNEWKYVKECLDTGWVSSVGSYVDLFEEKLAQYCQTKHAVLTSNGTVALQVALQLAGVQSGDEVLVPTLTFIATANAVSHCGAIPHFVESESQTPRLDVPKLAEYLARSAEQKNGCLYNKNTGRRIAAIVPVHIFGHPVDMEALQVLADPYGLPVISDAAEAIGSLYKCKPVTAYGLLSTLSFNGNKIITTGGGGAILTNDTDLAKRAKHLTTTAKIPHRWDFVHDEIGYNYRMPNINAALGCAQLEQMHSFLEAKIKLAQAYKKAFENKSSLSFIEEPPQSRGNYWLNAIKIVPGIDRDGVLGALYDAGYMCRPVWRLMHRLEMYKDCPRMDVSVSEALEQQIINLPSSVKLGQVL